MKKRILLLNLVLIIVFGCQKEEVEDVPLEIPFLKPNAVSLSFLPYQENSTLVFVSEDGREFKLKAKNGIELDTVWNYNNGGPTKIYTNEFRRVRFTANDPENSDVKQILVDLSVNKTSRLPYRFYDFLSINFSDRSSIMFFNAMTSNKGHLDVNLDGLQNYEEPEYIPNITLLNRNFTDVYKGSRHGLELYCAKGKGIVAFKDHIRFWVLDRIE